jgi:hypothetical protein
MDDLDKWSVVISETGFTDVTCKTVKHPITPWAKDLKQKEIG